MTKSITLSKEKYAVVDDDEYDRVTKYKWSFHPNGYAFRLNGKNCIFLHRFILGYGEKPLIDHINRDKLDNRKENLRFCTYQENSRNREIHKNNQSGEKGVYWDKKRKVWVAQITINRKTKRLGRFKSLLDAKKCYDDFAKKEYGNFFVS